jgi:outer membrane protein OmpA-like peptidoglycan-associated protein
MKFFLLIALSFLFDKAISQNITILNKYATDSSGIAPENFKLVNSSEFLFIVNDFELQETNSSQNLQGLINYSVNSFLDENFKISNQIIQINSSQSTIVANLTSLVNNACWLFDSEYKNEFLNYSNNTIEKLNQIVGLKSKRINSKSFEKTNFNDNEVGLFYFQKELLSLKKLINRDIANFIAKKQFGYSLANNDEYSDSESAPTYIQPIDDEIEIEQNLINGMDVMTISPSSIEKYNKYVKKNKRNRQDENVALQNSFNDRVLQLMESNNKLMSEFSNKFDNMQDQINAIKAEKSTVNSNQELQSEIAELKGMVKNITSNDNISKNKSQSNVIEIYFTYNSTEINSTSKIYLNQVIEGLVKNKTYRILITGFADKAGNSDYNLLLSQRRAIAVKDYLQRSGIDDSRLLVNFYGDSKAESENKIERKVSLEMMVNN